jgi:hypothetical protein
MRNKNTLGHAWENRSHFTPFVLSKDGLLGQEAKTFRNVSQLNSQESGRIPEGKAEHSSSSSHLFVPARKQSSSAQRQQPVLAIGRRGWFSHA